MRYPMVAWENAIAVRPSRPPIAPARHGRDRQPHVWLARRLTSPAPSYRGSERGQPRRPLGRAPEREVGSSLRMKRGSSSFLSGRITLRSAVRQGAWGGEDAVAIDIDEWVEAWLPNLERDGMASPWFRRQGTRPWGHSRTARAFAARAVTGVRRAGGECGRRLEQAFAQAKNVPLAASVYRPRIGASSAPLAVSTSRHANRPPRIR
jgi:hypothetical protein